MKGITMIRILSALSVLVVTTSLFATGCHWRVRSHGLYTQPAQVYVRTAPPPVRAAVTVRPAAPQHGSVWIHGHWDWQGSWVWMDGRWETPRTGYVWTAPIAQQASDGGYYYHPGHWRQANTAAPPAYQQQRGVVYVSAGGAPNTSGTVTTGTTGGTVTTAGTVTPGTVVSTGGGTAVVTPGTVRPGTVTPGTVTPGTVRPATTTTGTIRPGTPGVVQAGGIVRPAVPGTVRPTVTATTTTTGTVRPGVQTVGTAGIAATANAGFRCQLNVARAPRGGYITIGGAGFSNSTRVLIGGHFAPIVSRQAAQLRVQVPNNSGGGPVVVQNNGGSATCGSLGIM